MLLSELAISSTSKWRYSPNTSTIAPVSASRMFSFQAVVWMARIRLIFLMAASCITLGELQGKPSLKPSAPQRSSAWGAFPPVPSVRDNDAIARDTHAFLYEGELGR